MKQRVPWNVKGVRRDARDTAREAARRAGMPVGQWLDQAIIERAAEYGVQPQPWPQPHYPPHHAAPHAAQHEMQHRPWNPAQDPRFIESIQRLDRRLDQMAVPPQGFAPYPPQPWPHGYPQPQAAYPQPYPPAALPPMPPMPPRSDWSQGLDQAVAEISARQHALELDPAAPPLQPALQRPDYAPPPPPQAYAYPVPQAYAPPSYYAPPQGHAPAPLAPGLDLSGLERQLQGITSQIESLHRNDGFSAAIAELRKDLNEIGRTLMEAMPRRALDALEAEVRNLGERIDQSRMAGVDPATIANMERGLADVREALRTLTPAESLVGFEEAVRGLTRKIDQLAVTQTDPATLQQLEATITALRGIVSHVASNDTLAGLAEEVRGLAAKVDRVATNAGGFGPEALTSLEKRISDLPVLGALERGFGELKSRIDELQGTPAGLYGGAESGSNVSNLKRELDRTQDTLEALHGTLGLVVDRLAVIETGIQGGPTPAPSAALSQAMPPMPARTPLPDAAAPVFTPAPGPSLPSAPKAMADTPAYPPAPAASYPPAPAASPPREKPRPMPPAAQAREPINPNLPPDFPLEPGSGTPRMRPKASAAERIAASEAALAPGQPGSPEAAPTNFIAAARRAAQAAAPSAAGETAARDEAAAETPAKTIGQRVRALIVGGSAVLAVIATLHVAVRMLDPFAQGDVGVVLTDPPPGIEEKMLAEEEAEEKAKSGTGNMFSAMPPSGLLLPETKVAPAPPSLGNIATLPTNDVAVTGSVTSRTAPAVPAATPTPADSRPAISDRLPAPLRQAALNGDAGAEYEIAMRHLDGRGVAQNTAEAVRWLERAAATGLAPAQFRLGGLYEKGQGVKKNLETARKLYVSAAEKGNAKAMHNLAVLYAEGIDGKPDYKTAATWFRKAAEHGTADSQHNLGILFARGVGVEQNLAESYKWFALAAAQGDRDSASKRDDVATRLDQGSLMAAKLAIQTFVAKPQPEAAVTVKAPPGGWDGPVSGTDPRPAKKKKTGTSMRVTPS